MSFPKIKTLMQPPKIAILNALVIITTRRPLGIFETLVPIAVHFLKIRNFFPVGGMLQLFPRIPLAKDN